MTDTSLQTRTTPVEPPLSRPVRLAVAGCLAVGAVLQAAPQYAEHLLAGDLDREQQMAWGLAHQAFYRAEWLAGMVGSLLLLLGFLGLWQVTRWSVPRLTLVGAVVLTWGMSGQVFSETATYTAQVVTADVLGVRDAERVIADGYLADPGMVAGVLVPVILGMLVGLLLLVVALWRSGFPKGAVVALALWPLWDFLGPSAGPLTSELALLVAGVWLALVLARMPQGRWLGRDM